MERRQPDWNVSSGPLEPVGPARVSPAVTKKFEMPNLLVVLAAVRRRLLPALVVGLIAAVGVALAVYRLSPPAKSTVRTLIRIPPDTKYLLATSEPRQELVNHQKLQVAAVKSRLVLKIAIDDPQVAGLRTIVEKKKPLAWLESQLQADFSIAPEILRLTLTGENADELAVMLSVIVKTYLAEFVDKERVERTDRLAFVRDLREKHELDLKTRKQQQRELEQQAGSNDAAARAMVRAFAQAEMNAAEKELLQARAELRKLRVELAGVEAKHSGDDPPALHDSLIDAELDKFLIVQAKTAEVQGLNLALEETIKMYTRGENERAVKEERHKIKSKQESLDRLRASLRPQVIKQLSEKLRLDASQSIESLRARVAISDEYKLQLETEVDKHRQRMDGLTSNSIKLQAFREDLTHLEDLTKRFVSEELALQIELQAPTRVKIMEEGTVTSMSDQNRRMALAGIGALGAFGLVLFAFGWVEHRKRLIDSPDDVTRFLPVRLIGTIPNTGLPWLRQPFRRPTPIDGILNESYDALRTTFLRVASETSCRSLLITSARPGEGKTSLATLLASSLAAIGFKTLLVDADLRQPVVHRVFGVSNAIGFCDLVRGDASISEVMQKTPVVNLSVIPAGRWDIRATRALPRKTTHTIVRQLQKDHAFVLFDSAPVLPVVDALLVGQHVDGVVLSVLCNFSQSHILRSACERLTSAGCRLIGFVANGVETETYYPGYHEYANHAAEAAANSKQYLSGLPRYPS